MSEQQGRSLEGLYILLVEDSGVTALNTLRVLQERGGAVIEICTSLAAAKERIESARFDIVVLDQTLGSERGTDLALWLLHHRRADIRKILRVSYSGIEAGNILAGVPAEDTETIFAAMPTKPTSLRELMEVLREAAESYRKKRITIFALLTFDLAHRVFRGIRDLLQTPLIEEIRDASPYCMGRRTAAPVCPNIRGLFQPSAV